MSKKTSDIKDILKDMPPAQAAEVINNLLFKRFQNRDQLRRWCKFFLGVDLADCTVSRYASSNPLDMVWEIYSFCLDEQNQDPFSVFYIAGRSSQKTLSTAVLQVLMPLHFKRGVVHFGGTMAQSQRAYDYFKKFVSKEHVRPFLKSEPTQKKTYFVVDGDEIEIEILSLSPMSVQGPHQPVVSLDELGSLAPDKIKAYDDVTGIPVYTADGKPWIKFGISSRKGKYTVIEQEYEKRQKSGVEFRFWTVFENTKACPESIRGSVPTDLYVSPIENIAVTEEEFQNLSPEMQNRLDKVSAYDKCRSCPLAPSCGGDLARQTSKCRTLRPVQATIQQFKQAPSLEWWLSQAMSLTPSAEGLVFPKFKREIFEKTPNEIYEIFAGEPANKEISEQELINYMTSKGVKKYAGLDHGYTHPTAIVIIFEDSRDNTYIMKTAEQVGMEPNEVVKFIQDLHIKYQFTALYPDTEAPQVNKLIKKAKICSVIDSFQKDVEKGITLIRGKLAPTYGAPKVIGLKGNCESLIDNFEKMHFKHGAEGTMAEKINDKFDDSIAALRYAAQNRWDRGSGVMAGGMPNQGSSDESKEDYVNKVHKQQANWLGQEINKAVVDNKGSATVSSSKNKGFFWSID